MPYLSPRATESFSNYKYKSSGYTILDVWHTPLWNFLLNQMPMWLAPNLITLTGLSFVISAWLLDAWIVTNYVEETPRWLYLFRAVAVIIYVNLDCMDGKQARRTRSSSPLGQLFDHGCDALSVGLLLDSTHCSMNYPCGWVAAGIVNLVMLPWILAHWEEYHTGELLYGDGVVGVLESNYALAFIHLSPFVFGRQLWTITLNRYIPLALPFTLNVRHLYFAACIGGALSQMVAQYKRVFLTQHNLPLEEKGNKELGTYACIKHLVLVALLVFLGFWWTADPQAAPGQCRTAFLSFSLLYALFASILIIAHMAREPIPTPLWAFGALLFAAVNTQLHFVDRRLTAYALLALALAGYSHYIVHILQELCAVLGVEVFRIKVHPYVRVGSKH